MTCMSHHLIFITGMYFVETGRLIQRLTEINVYLGEMQSHFTIESMHFNKHVYN